VLTAAKEALASVKRTESLKQAKANRGFDIADRRDELLGFVDEYRERHPGCSTTDVARAVWEEKPFSLEKTDRVIDYERAAEHAKAKAVFVEAMRKRIGRAERAREKE
jgi:hypothetical protein